MVARLAAHLPHPGVALGPAARGGVGELDHEALDLGVKLAELLAVQVQGVEQLPVDVELGLVPGSVAHAHRSRIAPATQVRQLALGEVVLAGDAIHDLQRVAASGRTGHERNELAGLIGAGPDVERFERQARVADP